MILLSNSTIRWKSQKINNFYVAVQKSQKSSSKKRIKRGDFLKILIFLKKFHNLNESGFKSIQEIKKNFLKKI